MLGWGGLPENKRTFTLQVNWAHGKAVHAVKLGSFRCADLGIHLVVGRGKRESEVAEQVQPAVQTNWTEFWTTHRTGIRTKKGLNSS